MFEEIIKNYGDFSDALIIGIAYKSNFNYYKIHESGKKEVEISISCFNQCKDFQRELIKITFIDVEIFRFIKYDGMIQGALYKKENELITFDFFPKIIGKDKYGKFELEEDSLSDCIVKFKNLTYSVIE